MEKDDDKEDALKNGKNILGQTQTFDSSWKEFATKFKEKMDYEKMDKEYKKKKDPH